jgi:membrane protein DedA with SNARE-associated domain
VDENIEAVAAAHHHPVPSGPPNKLARNATIAILVSLVVASNLGNIFFATFVNAHPLALIAMNASNRNLALASGSLDALSFYAVGFARLFAPDLFFFAIGRWYGDAAIRWMERKAPTYGQLLRNLEQWFDKARFVVVAIAPNNPVCLFAGAAGMSLGAFLAANVVGTIGRLVLIRAFSSVFEDLLGSVRGFIGDYRWPLTALSLVLVAFTIWSDRRGGRDGIGDLVTLEEGIDEAEAELESELGDE